MQQLEQRMTAADVAGDIGGWVNAFLVWLEAGATRGGDGHG
jgi:hypothetical protein